MRTAVAAADGPKPDHICTARAEGAGHRCWKRAGHDGLHMAMVEAWPDLGIVKPWVDRW